MMTRFRRIWLAVLVCGACLGAYLLIGYLFEPASPISVGFFRRSPEERKKVKEEFERRPVAEQCKILNRDLRRGYIHDASILLADVGDHTSVPYLINALKGFSFPNTNNDPQDDSLDDCVQGHSRLALYRITNNCPGPNYSDWKAWWKANRSKTQLDWIHDGFRTAGLPVHLPPDEKYIYALVATMGKTDKYRREHYRALNAWRVLKDLPSEMVRPQALACAQSANPEDRLGSIKAFVSLDGNDTKERLDVLTRDTEVSVRESAIRNLNENLRNTTETQVKDQLIWKGMVEGELFGPGPDGHHVFISSGKRMMGNRPKDFQLSLLNLDSKRNDWIFSDPERVNSQPITCKTNVIFTLDSEAVYCLRASDGSVVWKNTPGTGYRPYKDYNKVILKDDAVLVMRTVGLNALTADTGHNLWKVPVESELTNWECADNRVVIASKQNEFLSISTAGEVLARKSANRPRVYAAFGNLVFTSTGGYPAVYAAINAETLEPVWQLPDAKGTYAGSLQTEELLLLGIQGERYYGIRKDSGQVVWSAEDPEFFPLAIVKGGLVTSGPEYLPEIRDANTGRLIFRYNEPKIFSHESMVVTEGMLIAQSMVLDRDTCKDNFWMLRLPPM